MSSIENAIVDLKRIIHAFKKEVPDNLVKSSLKELIHILLNLDHIPGSIEWGTIGVNFENFVIIDEHKAVLPDGVRILKLTGQYFLGEDHVRDEIHPDRVYIIGSEIEGIKHKR